MGMTTQARRSRFLPSGLRRCLIACTAVLSLGLGSSALAQGGGVLIPGQNNNTNAQPIAPPSAAPQPIINKEYPVWVGYLVMLLMTVAVMGISLMPSKRSHQD